MDIGSTCCVCMWIARVWQWTVSDHPRGGCAHHHHVTH